MSAKSVKGEGGKKPASAATNLIGRAIPLRSYESMVIMQTAGGGAGMMEALACHPLGMQHPSSLTLIRPECFADTIKVRMQLSRRGRTPGVRGPQP